MISDEDQILLSCFEDGELSGEQLSEFRQRLLREPELRGELDGIRVIDARLREYARRIDRIPVPEKISRLVRVPPGKSAAKLFSAAALVFVVTIGVYLISPKASDRDYSLLATLPSGQRVDIGENYLEVITTFQRVDGIYCRELITRDVHEIVCLADGSWQPVIEISRLDMPQDVYQPAGGYAVPIDRYVRAHLAGALLEPGEEEALIKSGWQSAAY